MAELGKEKVEFSTLAVRAAEESFLSLKELVRNAKSPEVSDTDKKVGLLKFVLRTQQRMLRLNALAEWSKQVPLIDYCQDLGSTLSSHDICFTQAADSLFYMHEGLQQARAPLYDVPSALEILLTGSYQRLPKCLDDVGMQCSLDEDQQKPALRKLEVLVRSKLLEMTLPKEITEVKVSKGTVALSVEGEFKVLVTLGYRGHISMWRILHLDLLVGERSGPIKLEVTRRHILGDDLERRMSVAENPFTILYAVLHELCVAIVMDTVIKQVRALLQGRWKDTIRFDLVLDNGSTPANQEGEAESVTLRTPGVKLMYWSDSDKNCGPFIKIEPGSDLKIRCFHSTFVVDPVTGKEAEFSLDQSCIDVEKLLLKAICCHRYTRLFEIQKELLRNAHICRASSDVILQSLLDEPGVEGGDLVDSEKRVEPEVLRVRAYGDSFFSLGINIRSGRFLLQSPKSILTSSVLKEYEDALNHGSIFAADAFTNLRSKSILHIFAAIGKFLGLEVCDDHGFGINKVSKSLSDGSDFLILGFPGCESSHFLLMELEKDFTLSFKLVETEVDGSGKPQSFNDLGNILRAKKIDIGQLRVLEDDLNLTTSDMVRSVSSFSDPEGLNQASEHHHTGFCDEASAEISGNQLSFSSIVDDLFGLQEGASATGNGVSWPPSDDSLLRKDEKSRKPSASDLVRLIPSLRRVEGVGSPNKRRKISESAQHESSVKSRSRSSQTLSTAVATSTKSVECAFGNLIAEANKGNAHSSGFFNALLHVVKHSSLSIKHAKLTRQMDALNIHYVEKMGLRDATSDIWFQLPFAQDDSWQHMCLQVGRPGDMRWDVKIKDRYFTDLWDLQKGSKTTPWGSGVRIANSSHVNSHIRYDSEGVVLNYQSVEADSIKKLVADIQRLSNARMLSVSMRKLLDIKQDERTEEGSANFDRWRAFAIEAVGLTSLWFRFGSIARFVVEWEPGRDGCTMHVSPDQPWPHTKFLEDFINGADVESLLDCIRLTFGPLNALAAATRPAPASNASGVRLLPIDVTVVLRGPYWIRIFYRKRFAMDMRCSVGDQVWLQPATPPKGGASIGGSLPCPQFRPFIMEHALLELNVLESLLTGDQQATNPTGHGGDRVNSSVSNATSRAAMKHILSVATASLLDGSGLPVCRTPAELHAACVALGDVGGYGGGWVPLVALKRVLRSIFKYLGVLWLFSQLPDLLSEILGSILKDKEGAVVSIDSEQPALCFFVRGYSFVVSVHRVQLVLQIRSLRRSHQQQKGSSTSSAAAQEELTESEIQEICDYFTRRVAAEPYDASRVASFITLLTLPIPALKEFLKLIAWKKALSQAQQPGETAPSHKPRIELENHSSTDSAAAKSNIHYDRPNNTVDFALTILLDPAHIPQKTNTAGGAAWVPYCVSVRLRYTFGDNSSVTFLGMEGSHGGRACWQLVEDWEKCKQRVSETVEDISSAAEDSTQGKLKLVAESVHRTLQLSLQGLRED